MFKRLEKEWLNKGEMSELADKVLALKVKMTYFELWMSLLRRDQERHAHNLDYIAQLLYLLDERALSVLMLQQLHGIQPGHLYRTLGRAGVNFKATTATGFRVEEPSSPYLSDYYDPINSRILRDGAAYPARFEWEPANLEEDRVVGEYVLPLTELPQPIPAPLPLWRGK